MALKQVEVVVRVRPLMRDDENSVEIIDDKTVDIINFRNTDEHLRYSFAKVYGQSTTQAEVFHGAVEHHIQNVMCGQNASILAYGPTGAGKTHTILGTPEDPGIIPRTIKKLFESMNNKSDDVTYTAYLSFMEIYNERVVDLLNKKPYDLQIREDKNHVIQVPGLSEKQIENYEQFNAVFGPATQNRTTASTKLNEYSSRSHSIMLLKIIKKQEKRTYTGKLYIIDLAGSENNKKTGNQGIRLKESGAINNSLFALGKVVDALTQGLPRIPYRDSKLTRLLQDSFGGNSHAVLITNLCPAMKDYMLTYNTLNFASKTKTIVNKPVVQETIEKTIIKHHENVPAHHIPQKKAKREEKHSAENLAPLLKNQKYVQKEVESINARLGSLERTILNQLNNAGNMTTVVDDSVAKATASQLQAIKEQLAVIQEQKDSGHPTETEEHVPCTSSETRKAVKVAKVEPRRKSPRVESMKSAKDMREEQKENYLMSETDEETPKLRSKAMERVPFDDSFDLSPSSLFINDSAVFLKKNKFKSTATRSGRIRIVSASSSVTPRKQVKTSKDKLKKLLTPRATPRKPAINPDLQEQHNNKILSLLNDGNMKDLMKLITIGKKKAQMIISYRDLYGPAAFAQVEDLGLVPGLTKNFVKSFMKSNLVQ